MDAQLKAISNIIDAHSYTYVNKANKERERERVVYNT